MKRTCCAGQSVFHGSSIHPRLSVAHITRASLRSTDARPQRKHADLVRKITPAAISAPDSQLTQQADYSSLREADEAFATLERAARLSSAERPSKSGVSGRQTLESPEELASTSGHRAIVGSAMLLLAGIGAQGLAGIHDSLMGASVCAAVAVAYVLADFGTGVYHWSVDNYGSGATPIVGDQIAAFQGHHQRPWTITQRQFANNLHKVFKPSIPFSAAWLAASSVLHFAPVANCFFAVFVFLVCMSQQFHAWGHMKKSELPPPVIALQEAGLLISRRAHGAHHKAPFEGNYCIVSGLWNGVLDQQGSDQGFFRKLERLVAARTGVEPRCWYEPKYEIEEMTETTAQPMTQ